MLVRNASDVCTNIQNVNSYHNHLKSWINRFYGVAIKDLDHYLSWFRFLDKIRQCNDDITVNQMIVEGCLFSMDVTYDKI
ncbi:hypothetical protein KQI60_01035 [Bacillus oleronius]|nr:hypothetical protein [Heyndrickxia oleronia]